MSAKSNSSKQSAYLWFSCKENLTEILLYRSLTEILGEPECRFRASDPSSPRRRLSLVLALTGLCFCQGPQQEVPCSWWKQGGGGHPGEFITCLSLGHCLYVWLRMITCPSEEPLVLQFLQSSRLTKLSMMRSVTTFLWDYASQTKPGSDSEKSLEVPAASPLWKPRCFNCTRKNPRRIWGQGWVGMKQIKEKQSAFFLTALV